MKKLIPALLPVLIFAISCSDTPEVNNNLLATHTPLVQKIFYSDDSLFRGIALGMSKPEVKKAFSAGDSLSQEETNYLLFEGKFDAAKYYTWECEFDSAGLFALTLDVYLTDEKSATDWFKDITAYFTDRYGPAVDDGFALSWEVKSGKRPARVELYEDTEYPYGKLTVYYYDLSFIPMESDSLPTDSIFLPTDVLQ
jgi:hypothetical protein